MENDVDIPLIRYELQHGSDETQAFINFCRDHELDLPLDSTVDDLFKRFRNFDILLENEIGTDHYSILRSIVLQYSKLNYAIFSHDDDVWNHSREIIIQGRFKLVGDNATNSFAIFDSFNGGLRTLQTPIGVAATCYFPTLVNHERILLNVVHNRTEHLLLLDAGFDQLNSSNLHEISFEFVCYQIILDSTDNLRFLLRAEDNGGNTFVCKGHIADDRIHLDHEKILFGSKLFCCKFEGDRLFAFRREQDTSHWHYTEYNLSLSFARIANQWPCSGFPTCADIFNEDHEYVWSGNKLYAVHDFAFDGYFSIVVFDADTVTWSKVNFIGEGRADKLVIKEDDILSISATESQSEPLKSKMIYRLPVRKPDKLRYIAWFKIRREAIFAGSNLYDRLAPRLPFNSEFRKFSENY